MLLLGCVTAWAATKIRSATIVNSTLDSSPVGSSSPSSGNFSSLVVGGSNTMSSATGNSGSIAQAGTMSTTSGLLTCSDGSKNVTTTGCNVFASFTNKNLASNVGVSASTTTAIDSVTVTMPSSGGPYRVRINYNYFQSGGVSYDCWVSDGTYSWDVYEATVTNNRSGCSASAVSPTTYSGGANKTFTVYTLNTGSSTITTSSNVGSNPATECHASRGHPK